MDDKLYSGQRFLDIESVWTDKTTYPYALIYKNSQEIYKLLLTNSQPRAKINGAIFYQPTACLEYAYTPPKDDIRGAWTKVSSTTSYPSGLQVVGQFCWASQDITIYPGVEVMYHYNKPRYIVNLPQKTKEWITGFLGYLGTNTRIITDREVILPDDLVDPDSPDYPSPDPVLV